MPTIEVLHAEEALLDILRDHFSTNLSLSVARVGEEWTVSLATSNDGLLQGRGPSFVQAFRRAFGFEIPDPSAPESQPARPGRPSLAVIEGGLSQSGGAECRSSPPTVQATCRRRGTSPCRI